MKNLFLISIIIVSLFSFTSCNSFIEMRVNTIKDGSIIRLKVNEEVAKYYKEWDTVTIERSSHSWDSWKILNDTRRKDSHEYYGGFYYYTNKSKTDSSYVGGYSQEYKNVVIEKIIK